MDPREVVCKACQHPFESHGRVVGYYGYRRTVAWDDLCEVCILLHAALAKMQEAKGMLARVKELAAARKGIPSGGIPSAEDPTS